MLKKSLLFYFSAIVVNLCVCWIIAVVIQPKMDESLPAAAIEDQLSYTFGNNLDWHQSNQYPLKGEVKRGALFRKVHVSGWSNSNEPVFYAEDILKVGWPFTTVRGFAHQVGNDVRYVNAYGLASANGPRFFPLEVVWPGLILNSALFALTASLIWWGFQHRTANASLRGTR